MLRFHLQFRIPGTHLNVKAPRPQRLVRCSISDARPNPARDRVVDFGKHRGKMLGSLPSPYLRWISKNLRAGDTEEWARLADQVLEDPVYRDRVEWEYAEKVLNGDVLMNGAGQTAKVSSVEALLEISERFGWDNDDKVGWSKVKFELLGTSRCGRIPRVADKASSGGGAGASSENAAAARRRRRSQGSGDRERRREERRERRMSGGSKNDDVGGGEIGGESGGRAVDEIHNPFPGRESLLRKAMIGRRIDL